MAIENRYRDEDVVDPITRTRTFVSKTYEDARDYFGDEPGAVIGFRGGNYELGLALYAQLIKDSENISFIDKDHGDRLYKSETENRKLLIVTDDSEYNDFIDMVDQEREKYGILAVKVIRGDEVLSDDTLEEEIIHGLEDPRVQEFKTYVCPPISEYIGDNPACVVALRAGGTYYGLILFDSLLHEGHDVNFAETNKFLRGLLKSDVKGRVVIITEDDILSSRTYRKIKDSLKNKKPELGFLDDIFACGYDMIFESEGKGLADFSTNAIKHNLSEKEKDKKLLKDIDRAYIIDNIIKSLRKLNRRLRYVTRSL